MKKCIVKRIITITLMIVSVLGLCACESNTVDSGSETWKPDRTVTIICGYGVGGSSDLFARIVAKELSEYWGVDVIVKNVEGASGAIGTTECFYSIPDGYTVFVSNGATITQSVQGEVEWNYSDFTNIARVIDEDEILCVSSSSNINSLKELISLCKKKPREMSIGVAGVGGYTYLAAERFIEEQDLDVKVVAYNSGAEVVSAVMGGFVDFCIQQPAELYSGIESKKLKPISIMAKERHSNSMLSDIKTAREQDVDFVMTQWRGISAPANIPDEVKTEWINALTYISESESFASDVENILHTKVSLVCDSEFDSFLDEENSWVENIMREIGLVE